MTGLQIMGLIAAVGFLGVVLVCLQRGGFGRFKGFFSFLGNKMGFEAREARPGVVIREAQTGGDVNATDCTGRGADVSSVKAKGDLNVTSAPPPADPKV